MPVTLKLHKHNVDCILEHLNMKHILDFHTKVISNTLICLFYSFYQVATFVQKQKCALFSGALITWGFFLKMYLYVFPKYTFFGSIIF